MVSKLIKFGDVGCFRRLRGNCFDMRKYVKCKYVIFYVSFNK